MRQISARQTISVKRRLNQSCECRIRLFGETLVTAFCKNAALNAIRKHSRFFTFELNTLFKFVFAAYQELQ